jgi:hypothetical protein
MIRRLVAAAVVGEVVRRVLKAKPAKRKGKARRKRAKARSKH